MFTRALKSLEIGTLIGSFYPKWKMYDLKIYREFCAIEMKSDQKFEEKLTCGSENDMWRIWQNFHRLKNNNFILESKMAELNQKKTFETTRSNRCSDKIFFLPWKEMNSTITETFLHLFYRIVVLKV